MSFVEKALERAKLARQKGEPEKPVEMDLTGPHLLETLESADLREIKDIQYIQTCTVPIDMDTMIRNRLISSGFNPELVESYKLLRTHILQKTQAQRRNTLMVASPLPDEGKTLTAINLAITMAQELTQTVLLVDLDMRHPSIPRYFGFQADYGVVDYLEGKLSLPELLVHPQGIDGLVILPAGRPTEWAVELIRSPRMLELVPELKSFYPDRYVIFDLPPMLSFADALSFAPLVDGVIMVVEARRTSREDLKRCQEMLHAQQILGYVFNKAEDLNQSRYYHYNKRAKDSQESWLARFKGGK